MSIRGPVASQRGAATLFTSIMLLIGVTLIALAVSKSVLVETQITADNYRIRQANAAANAGMDRAVAYFSAGGLDQRNNTSGDLTADGLVDYTQASPFPVTTMTAGGQTTSYQFYFDNTDDNACDCQLATAEDIDGDGDGDCMGTLGTNMTRGLVTARGWSDDNSAVRTITQCLTTLNPFRGEGPRTPFVTTGSLATFGTGAIINRYNNSNVWTGQGVGTTSAAFKTYLRPSGTTPGDYTRQQLDSSCAESPCNVSGEPGPNTQIVSTDKTGLGIDIISNDPTLSVATDDQFFQMFFSLTKSEFMNAADSAGQKLAAGASPSGMSGMIWIGDATVGGSNSLQHGDVLGDYAAGRPAIMVVNGDLAIHGGTIYGVVYVAGTLVVNGGIIKGTILSKSGLNSAAGNPVLVYTPMGDGSNQNPKFIPGTAAVVAGSWKDW